MSDFARFLPLSQRGGRDESGVSSDWSPQVSAALLQVAGLLDTLTADQWSSPSLREGWSVREQAGRLDWRLRAERRDRWRAILRLAASERVTPRMADEALSRRAALVPPDQLVASIRSLATAPHRRRPVSDLAEVVLHGYDIARPLARTIAFDPLSTGAVALARSLAAPVEIKAVLRGLELQATDAAWSVGRGPRRLASAEEIIRFLYARDADALRGPLAGAGDSPAD